MNSLGKMRVSLLASNFTDMFMIKSRNTGTDF